MPTLATTPTATATPTATTTPTPTSQTNNPWLLQWGEEIIYQYLDGEGHAHQKEILAVIDRSPPVGMTEIADLSRPVMTVAVANDTDDGISSAAIDTGTDRLIFPRRIGGGDETFTIGRIVAQDDDPTWPMMTLEVR